MNRTQSKTAADCSELVVAFAVAANGYTVVLKGGKRIQIPEKFVVTPAVVTYESPRHERDPAVGSG